MIESGSEGGDTLRPNSETGQWRRPSVLVVEDEKRLQPLLKTILEEHAGANVAAILEGGQEVKDWLDARGEEELDLVITDLGLADGREAGYDVIRAVRERYPHCEAYLLTGLAAALDEERLRREKGVDRLIGKPLRMGQIVEPVTALAQRINRPQPPQGK